MPWKWEDRQEFLDRAEELRSIVVNCKVPENRDMLLNMAGYYERFAREVEARIWDRDHEAVIQEHPVKPHVKQSEPERVAQPNDRLRAVGHESRPRNHRGLAQRHE